LSVFKSGGIIEDRPVLISLDFVPIVIGRAAILIIIIISLPTVRIV
jgi:hypothetical protein